jgi:predicted glycosyltransferase
MVLLWVESVLGSGHLRRALTLARALAETGLRVTLATGTPSPWPLPPGVERAPLPTVRAEGMDFARLVGADGRPVDEALWTRRREALLALFRDLSPSVVVTEMFPFGRNAFRHELLPLLEAARGRARLVCSVRDVLVAKGDPLREARMRDLALRYERILVHGDPRVIPFGATFPHADALGARLVHTGYVAEPPPPPAPGPPEVLVSAGGGAVGARLLLAAIEARARTGLAAAPWRLIGGRRLPADELERLLRRAAPGIVVERERPDLPALLGRCLLSVSQAGYNTVVEALAAGCPMVLVPFAAGAETEQTTRALRLAGLGLAEMVQESHLTGETLARAIDRALATERGDRRGPDLGGAGRAAGLIRALEEGG